MDTKEEKFRDTYSWLFDESEEEKEVQSRIDQERLQYESSEEYKAHMSKMDSLFDELSEASKKRRVEGRKHRRHQISDSSGKKVQDTLREAKIQRKAELEEKIQKLIEEYRELDRLEKQRFNWYKDRDEDWVSDELGPYVNPETTKTDIDQLHEILVQTALDFLEEKNLHDIDEVHFSVDGLQGSVPYGEWCSCTDSSLSLVGLQDETYELPDGEKRTWKVRKFIGRSI